VVAQEIYRVAVGDLKFGTYPANKLLQDDTEQNDDWRVSREMVEVDLAAKQFAVFLADRGNIVVVLPSCAHNQLALFFGSACSRTGGRRRTWPPIQQCRAMLVYLVDVIGVDMVASMRRAPGKVRTQEKAVREEANRIGDELVAGERAVASFVSQDPESGGGQGHEERVDDEIEDPLVG
jgi:hypothetical protein